MITHPITRILVVLFSICLGGCIVWQTSNHMANTNIDPNSSPVSTDDPPAPVIISTKNPNASIRLEDSEQLQKLFPNPAPQEKKDFEEKKQTVRCYAVQNPLPYAFRCTNKVRIRNSP